MQKQVGEKRSGFDPALKGKRAECDGGGLSEDGRYVTRQDFTGTLTGDYYDEGDPPWRWYLLAELTVKPDNSPAQAVWCESESLFLLEEDSACKSGKSPGARLDSAIRVK